MSDIIDIEAETRAGTGDCTPINPDVDPIYPGPFDKLSSLDVITRYSKLMEATLAEGSLYERSKKTIDQLSKEFNLTEQQRAELVAGQITQMTIGLSTSAMQTAFTWAKEDATIGYQTALLNAQARQADIAATKIGYDICLVQKQEESVCVDIETKLASSLRENGTVTEYDKLNPCRPVSLADEGLKFAQEENFKATEYSSLADTYRKSGKVSVAIDNDDGIKKGVTGDDKGHTNAQTNVALRQIIGFEDSKRNHAVNASSQTIGQIISAEAELDPTIVENYNKGMEYLLQNSPSILPGGPADLDPVDFDFSTTDTDTLTCDSSTPPVCVMDVQVNQDTDGLGNPTKGYITLRAVIPAGNNTRVGDKIVLNSNGGEYTTYIDVTSNVISQGYVLIKMPSVILDLSGAETKEYALDLYVQDYYGNKSSLAEMTVQIQYSNI